MFVFYNLIVCVNVCYLSDLVKKVSFDEMVGLEFCVFFVKGV